MIFNFKMGGLDYEIKSYESPYLECLFVLAPLLRDDKPVFLEYGGHPAMPHECVTVQPHLSRREVGVIHEEG